MGKEVILKGLITTGEGTPIVISLNCEKDNENPGIFNHIVNKFHTFCGTLSHIILKDMNNDGEISEVVKNIYLCLFGETPDIKNLSITDNISEIEFIKEICDDSGFTVVTPKSRKKGHIELDRCKIVNDKISCIIDSINSKEELQPICEGLIEIEHQICTAPQSFKLSEHNMSKLENQVLRIMDHNLVTILMAIYNRDESIVIPIRDKYPEIYSDITKDSEKINYYNFIVDLLFMYSRCYTQDKHYIFHNEIDNPKNYFSNYVTGDLLMTMLKLWVNNPDIVKLYIKKYPQSLTYDALKDIANMYSDDTSTIRFIADNGFETEYIDDPHLISNIMVVNRFEEFLSFHMDDSSELKS